MSWAKAKLLVQQGKVGPVPDAENAPSLQEECPDAEPAWDGVATGDLQTDLFEVDTDRFIVSYEVLERPRERGLPSFQATVEDADGRSNSSGKVPSPQPGAPVRIDLTPNMGRTIVDVQPGNYKVAVSPTRRTGGTPSWLRSAGSPRSSLGYRPSSCVADMVMAEVVV